MLKNILKLGSILHQKCNIEEFIRGGGCTRETPMTTIWLQHLNKSGDLNARGCTLGQAMTSPQIKRKDVLEDVT
ncbi:hypothetical protein C5167_040160 [Papaver somniferum]|uniref:Uncharacterized protein n=1 Tax=Papaver somniferum TaxID=3469 RepID=A0A4Y7IHN3_PAPSO|nr:hypothetical protein C5167_040160 [Papaver somniferum]